MNILQFGTAMHLQFWHVNTLWLYYNLVYYIYLLYYIYQNDAPNKLRKAMSYELYRAIPVLKS